MRALIEFSLRHRLLVLGAALLLLVFGIHSSLRLPVDVFPELDRPTVTIMTEAAGLAPEEVETLVTWPLETVMNGGPGVERVRSSSAVGLSIVHVEFGWDTEIFMARQIVQERLLQAAASLPEGVLPVVMPIASIMGEIFHIGLTSPEGEVGPVDLRSLADWEIRPRLLGVPGVAHVTVIGGGVRQIHVRPDPVLLARYGVTLAEVAEAARQSQGNTGGGFVEGLHEEILIRNIGRTADVEEIAASVISGHGGVPLTLGDVAEVRYGTAVARGDAGVDGKPGVMISVQKQPAVNSVRLTARVKDALGEIEASLPPGVELAVIFEQADFIRVAVGNVATAIRDGGLLVSLVLFIFLLNLRTTLITLVAIPLSFVVAAVTFVLMGATINTMTLGGLAVAAGMLVDDAIVTTENTFRRLRENRLSEHPRPALRVIADAVREVAHPVVLSTVIIALVFIPLFGLGGIEGRLFRPVAVATIVSMFASTLVALTVVPVLASYLLPRARRLRTPRESWIVRGLKAAHTRFILRSTLRFPALTSALCLILAAGALSLFPRMGTEFLPEFNEGSFTAIVTARPGTSLTESNRIGAAAERMLLEIPGVEAVGRRTGRAELDDHAEGTNTTEIEIRVSPNGRSREALRADIRSVLGEIPGVSVRVDQPITHRLDHMMAGVEAQIAVKIFGHSMDGLRRTAEEIETVMRGIEGVVDLSVEPLLPVRQYIVEADRAAARAYGLRVGDLNDLLETALRGRVVGQLIESGRTTDIFVRYPRDAFADIDALAATLVDIGHGRVAPLGSLATVRESKGPTMINRENVQRRIIVSANTAGRDLGSVVNDIRAQVERRVELPEGTFVRYEGEFAARQDAARMIAVLSVLTTAVIFLVLYSQFGSLVVVGHLLLVIPMAFSGGLIATWFATGTISVATLVGLITLAGIASRNTLLMVNHYIQLVQHEGERFDDAMIIRGSRERLIPMLMTALTTGLALAPLALAAGQPGKEILYPIAVVITGGLVTSTLADIIFTPAFFKRFGRPAARRILAARRSDPLDALEPTTHRQINS